MIDDKKFLIEKKDLKSYAAYTHIHKYRYILAYVFMYILDLN